MPNLYTQSYREAKESGLVPECTGLGIVHSSLESKVGQNPYDKLNLRQLDNILEDEAKALGADYVFGIDYKVEYVLNRQYTLVTGDACKIK